MYFFSRAPKTTKKKCTASDVIIVLRFQTRRNIYHLLEMFYFITSQDLTLGLLLILWRCRRAAMRCEKIPIKVPNSTGGSEL